MTPITEIALVAGIASGTSLTMLAAAASDPAGGIAPYVGGGAGVIAVGGLVEVTRRLLNGRLIPRETKDVEDELGAAIVAAGQREAKAMENGEAHRKATEAMVRAVEDVRDEMRELRRVIERGA